MTNNENPRNTIPKMQTVHPGPLELTQEQVARMATATADWFRTNVTNPAYQFNCNYVQQTDTPHNVSIQYVGTAPGLDTLIYQHKFKEDGSLESSSSVIPATVDAANQAAQDTTAQPPPPAAQ